MKKISFYVGEAPWQRLNELAQQEGRTASELARQALTEFVRSYKPLPAGDEKAPPRRQKKKRG